MAAIKLTPQERKPHRAEAHHLDPVVMVGNDGLTPAVKKETDAALNAHGLIKVRVLAGERDAREAMLMALCDELGAAPIQHIGKLLVLWRPMEESDAEPVAEIGGGPRTVKILKFSKKGNRRPEIKKVTVLGNQRVTAGGMVKRAKKRITSLKKKA
jgi:putative YhbY family RNA-binding protein